MKVKSKLLKKIIVHSLCVLTVIQAVCSTVSFTASVDYYGSLGTQAALNSPVLNNQFNNENWNKWEMVCWGIYISNFAQPFIDTYETAFDASASNGSKGNGYRALVFGGATDAGSEQTLQNLLTFAIGQQKGDYEKQIYVTFNDINSDGTITRHDPEVSVEAPVVPEGSEEGSEEETSDLSDVTTVDTTVQPAKVSDLFFQIDDGESNGRTYADYGSDSLGVFNSASTIETGAEREIAYCDSGRLPTFWIESSSGYEKIFDYTDSWDPQVFAANLIKTASGEYSDELIAEIDKAFEEDYSLVMDCFGNICAKTSSGKKVLVQAASNQHLTKDESVNLLTSTIFNGYMAGVSETKLVNYARQSGDGGLFGKSDGGGTIPYGGLPAFGGSDASISSGTVLCYYDLDTIMVQNHIHDGSLKNSSGIHYGKAVEELFNCDINNNLGSNYSLKIEALNSVEIAKKIGPESSTAFAKNSVMLHTVNVANMLANQLDNNSNRANILSSITDTDGKEISIFTEPVLVPVQADLGYEITDSSAGITGSSGYRFMFKHLYEVYKKGFSNTYVNVSRDDLASAFEQEESGEFAKNINLTSDEKMTAFGLSFVTNYKGSLYNISGDPKTFTLAKLKYDDRKGEYGGGYLPLEVKSGKNSLEARFSYGKKGTASMDSYLPGRLVLVYPVSEVMKAANNFLGLKDGSEYSAYASKIYMTYLDWYGIKGSGDEATSNFNERIFENSSVTISPEDIAELTDTKSAEQKEQEILDMTYLMLHPTEGREYRTTLVKNNLADFLYSQYQTVVYGESVSYNSGNLTTTKSAGGFLNIETLTENTFTAAFIKNYSDIIATLIVVLMVIIVIMGLLKGRKISWYIISFAVAINTLLLVPASGEIVPYLANKMVQSIFSENMTFWSLSEAIENAALEAEVTSGKSSNLLGDLTADERQAVLSLVESLNVVNLDRSLVVKRDISSKVNQDLEGNYSDIQNLRSARWLLPTIMKQFTAEDGSADYVSIPLGDIYDDLSNLYWAYKPLDAETANTITSNQSFSFDDNIISDLANKNYYPGWTDISAMASEPDSYKNHSYSRVSGHEELEHTYMYIIADERVKVPSLEDYVSTIPDGYKNLDSLNGYAEYIMSTNTAVQGNMASLVGEIEKSASSYDRTDRTTVNQIYGYLWTTETPYHYFYGVCKDTFGTSDVVDNPLTMASIIGEIQGTYVLNDDNEEVRTNFMYAGETGYVKDVLDLEDLFTNTIPYMYQMQLLAGGDDGTGGALEGIKITDQYSLYEGSDAAWLFRSNWVTKLIENPSYADAEKVKDASDNVYTINNPMLAFTYPDERPMVFSEAQMHASGLTEADLTVAEMKCIEINKAVARRWTMLLNYANTDGMTREVLIRQMATEAVLEFNSQLSPTGIISGSYAMYPNSLDLRALSFDSVMRMLLLNITKNTGYLHSDTMLNVIANLDLFSAVLLWLAAGLCSYIVPLGRRLLMAVIFYIGLISTVYSMFSSNAQKTKKACAQVIINLAFLGGTVVYYGFFKLLMGITATDSVLTVSSVQVNAGNPLWCFILIIAISIVYIVFMIYMIKFCFLNFKDMGVEMISAMAGTVTSKISGAVGNVTNRISSFFSSDGDTGSGINMKGTGKSEKAQDVIIRENKTPAQDVKIKDNDDGAQYTEDYGKATIYNDGVDVNSDSSRFDREIEKGRNMGD